MKQSRGVGGMSTRTASKLAWGLCVLSLALTALSLLLLILNLSHPNTHLYEPWLDNTLTAVFYPTVGALGPIRNPLGVEGFTSIYTALLYIINTVALGAVVLSVFMRLRHALGVERQQIKWFAYAAAGSVIAGGVAYLIPIVVDTPLWFERMGFALNIAFIPAIPIAIAIAILRYYDIDIIINRTLVYGSLTAMLVALYFVGIVVLQRVFVFLTSEQSTLAIVASTLLIAALFNPLRRRIQSFIDRRFYRRKYDAAKTLQGF